MQGLALVKSEQIRVKQSKNKGVVLASELPHLFASKQYIAEFGGIELAPQVGLEPTTLRLTAEFQGEAMRIKKWKSLKTGVLHT